MNARPRCAPTTKTSPPLPRGLEITQHQKISKMEITHSKQMKTKEMGASQ